MQCDFYDFFIEWQLEQCMIYGGNNYNLYELEADDAQGGTLWLPSEWNLASFNKALLLITKWHH